jgi:hypothetical protein
LKALLIFSFNAGVDFRLSDYCETDLSTWNAGKVQITPDLHETMKGYGGFPDKVFVRSEMKTLWALLEEGIKNNDKFVVVGSPGVGKTTLVILLSLHFANKEKRNVFFARKLKDDEERAAAYAVMCLRSDGHHRGFGNIRHIDVVVSILDAFEKDIGSKNYLLVIDGWRQEEINASYNALFAKFDLLSTSAQYSPKSDESYEVCLLPAWQRDDLKLLYDEMPSLQPPLPKR